MDNVIELLTGIPFFDNFINEDISKQLLKVHARAAVQELHSLYAVLADLSRREKTGTAY